MYSRVSHICWSFSVVLLLLPGGMVTARNSMFHTLEKRYGITVKHAYDGDFFPRSWIEKPISARFTPLDDEELKRFPSLLEKALSRYPERVIRNNLKGINLAGGIYFYNLRYGGTYTGTIVYLTSGGVRKGYTDTYIIGSFHHEFSSILLRNYRFPKSEWLAANPKGFSYRFTDHGGRRALQDGSDSLTGTAKLYRDGFLNQYSTAGFEEDLNEYSGRILTDPAGFKKLMKTYPRIEKKFRVWLSYYRSVDRVFTEDYIFNR